ncbi:hypothetical protein APS56_02185 [Pseudalgibacter alginicilyticus]|uniref:Glycosyltransferase 2-like domain-containing protein n=1 Tax=Pseudalgibacter alginicilyticus TaxID=1736674 RepID=A0A0P0D5T7_9FLAO|nr:glycosyltransferase [Pseudalgibacter alginicilyticus]ALJ04035.1 hypothetical protein APS56_02185 [Pseudalgibacter alginicilyticus]
MLISIIVPFYNTEKFIARCIESLIEQDIDYNDYEIILVNDGSTDSSLSIAKHYAKEYQQIKIINQINKGTSAARNNGFKNSIGTYIYYIDSDDYIQKNILKSLLGLILENNLDFLGFKYTNTSESNFELTINADHMESYANNLKIKNGCTFISDFNFYNYTWWYIFKKDIALNNKIEFVEGVMLEDGIYTAELLIKCKRTAFIPLSIYRYFVNTNSIMRKTSKEHINHLNKNFKFIITKFTNLIDLAKHNNADYKAVKRLQARQQSYLFFLLVRLVKSNCSFNEIQSITNEFKLLKVYPLNKFIGVDYNSKKERILTHIFNNKILFFLLISFNNYFKLIK